jgi:cell division protein DivIC
MITKTRKKRSYQSLFASAFIVILTLGLIGFLVVSNWKINQRRSELMSRIESLKEEIQTLEGEKAELQAGITMSPEEENLETAAREQLGLKKPGEEVVSIKQEQNEEEVKQEEKKSFWQKIWEKLKL